MYLICECLLYLTTTKNQQGNANLIQFARQVGFAPIIKVVVVVGWLVGGGHNII